MPVNTPEQRLAQKVVRKLRLAPPIDIEEVLREQADLEDDAIPFECDAVLLRASLERKRPLVIVSNALPPKRRRFTLAHEYGHIRLPWHVGTIVCHTEGTTVVGDYTYQTMESEANRFASEILLPSDWVRGILDANAKPRAIVRELREADVSDAAIVLGLFQMMPPGWIVALTDSQGRVVVAGASPGTVAKPPQRGDLPQMEDFELAGAETTSVPSGAGRMLLLRFPDSIDTAESEIRPSAEVLQEILERAELEVERRVKLTQSINGIVGAANNKNKLASEAELKAILAQAFTGRPELRAVVTDKDFGLWLSMKSLEVVAKRSGAR